MGFQIFGQMDDNKNIFLPFKNLGRRLWNSDNGYASSNKKFFRSLLVDHE